MMALSAISKFFQFAILYLTVQFSYLLAIEYISGLEFMEIGLDYGRPDWSTTAWIENIVLIQTIHYHDEITIP